MPASAAVSNVASRCRNQLGQGLARRFSSALSISSSATAFSTTAFAATSTATKSSSIIPALNTSIFDSSQTHSGDRFLLRTMATSNRKAIDAKNAKRLKIQQKKKKNPTASKTTSGADGEGSGDASANQNNPFLQHQEWVKFQQSITVDGFQTGQTTTATVLKKSRGGKQARRKREKELARLGAFTEEASGSISAVAQKFPAIRYSPEETEDLLRQAYATLPPREGKRGNRNLRRQNLRWKKVRKIRSDYKANMINAHYDRMEARHYRRVRTKEALEEAESQRERDLAYQGAILQRWMDVTMGETGSESSSSANATSEGSA